MGTRIIHGHLIEQPLQHELDDLLRAAEGKVPSSLLERYPHFFGDAVRFGKEPIRTLTVGHSATISPGRQSGFRIQYQVPSGSSIRLLPSSSRRRRTTSSSRVRMPSPSYRTMPW